MKRWNTGTISQYVVITYDDSQIRRIHEKPTLLLARRQAQFNRSLGERAAVFRKTIG